MTQFIFLLNSVKCVYRLHDRQRMYGQIRQLVAIQAVLVLLQDEIQTVPHKGITCTGGLDDVLPDTPVNLHLHSIVICPAYYQCK